MLIHTKYLLSHILCNFKKKEQDKSGGIKKKLSIFVGTKQR